MTDLFFRNPRLLTLAVLLILVSGLSSAMLLPRLEDPTMTPRAATITTVFPGADPERVESLVTERIEAEIEEIEEIKEIRSTSRQGVSFIVIELRDDVYGSAAGLAWSRIRDKTGDVVPFLPNGASEPIFDQLDVKAFSMIIAMKWNQSTEPSYAILRRHIKKLEDLLGNLPGTEKMDTFGDPEEEITVSVDPETAAALNLNAASLAQQIALSDSKVAAGSLRGTKGDTLLAVDGELDSLSRIGKTPIRLDGDGSVLQLSDIAAIRKSIPQPAASQGFSDGKPAVALGLYVRPKARIDLWTNDVEKVLTDYRSKLPPGLELKTIFRQDDYVASRLESLLGNLMLGASAVFLVILVMMGWRSAIIVGSALPLSSLMVLAGLRFLEIPIHQMSITGLIIALGLLIDNAIVIVDEVTIRLREGMSPSKAVSESVGHLAVPLFGSTLTTALAFGPIALMPGPAGEFVGSIAISVVLAVFSSFLLALTIIPAFAAFGIRVSDDGNRIWWKEGISIQWVTRLYRRFLQFVFRRPIVGVGLGMVLPVFGFIQATTLDEQFFPPADRDQIQIEIELSASGSMAQTIDVTKQISKILKEENSVSSVHWFVGQSAPTFYYNIVQSRKNAPRYAQALVQRTTDKNSKELIQRLQLRLNKKLPNVLTLVRQLEQGPPFYAPIELKIMGPDIRTLQDLGDKVRQVMASTPGIVQTRAELSEPLQKVVFTVDEDQARLAGLDHGSIARQLSTSLDGAIGGSVVEQTEELPVRVRIGDRDRADLVEVSNLDLVRPGIISAVISPTVRKGNDMQTLPLSAISEMELDSETAGIPRFNGQRMNEVQAFLPAGVLPGRVLKDFRSRLASSDFHLPAGYRIEYGGEDSKRNDAIGNLLSNVAVLLVVMLATLVLSFQSFRMAGIIASVATLSVGLGLGALWFYGYPFGFMAIIGTMGLIGVAINDSIVVLAGILGNRKSKAGDLDELEDVVVLSTRHILATTFTTTAGFAPLVFGGSSFWPPLAVAISGGVVGATVLALIFVPCLFLIVNRFKNKSVEETIQSNQKDQNGDDLEQQAIEFCEDKKIGKISRNNKKDKDRKEETVAVRPATA